MRSWSLPLVLAVLVGGCRRVPGRGELGPPVAITNLTLAFPGEEVGDLYFEVELPADLEAVALVRWELWLGNRRFAEGVVASPGVSTDASGKRHARVEAPLVYRHLGWRDGSTWLEVGLKGELTPTSGASGARRGFAVRERVLVTGSPVFDGRD